MVAQVRLVRPPRGLDVHDHGAGAPRGARRDLRRRTFLHGLAVSALAVDHASARAQGATPLLSEGKPSRTAQATANLRAAHQLLDRPRIFDDPLALRIIGVQAEAAVRANLGRSPIATF